MHAKTIETTSSARMRAKLSGVLAGLLLAGSLVSGLPAAAAETQPAPLIDLVTVIDTSNRTLDSGNHSATAGGARDALDGGDVAAVVVANQAFGVVYGSAQHPLSAITMFTIVKRSLGTATVKDEATGRVLASDAPLPFGTLIAERLDAIFEFRDANGDGMFNFRPNLGTGDPFDFNGTEFYVKGAPLYGDWNLTRFDLDAVSDDQVNVTWVLTRENLDYRVGLDVLKFGDGVLNKVEFTLHVTITREVVHGATIPHFAATVKRDGTERTLTALTADGTEVRDYTAIHALFKVDHDIVGWDFAPPRLDVESRLVVRATIVYANAVDKRLVPWMNEEALEGERAGSANVSSEDNETEVTPDEPLGEFHLATGVGLRDGFGAAGRVSWDANVTVWPLESSQEPVTEHVNFQVLGGVRFAGSIDGRVFAGFVLGAGFVYPAGYRIYHDPELAAESVEIAGSSVLPSVLPALILVGETVLVVAAMAGVLAVAARAASGSAKAKAVEEGRRLEALKQRYQLPQASEPPRRGGE